MIESMVGGTPNYSRMSRRRARQTKPYSFVKLAKHINAEIFSVLNTTVVKGEVHYLASLLKHLRKKI